jgi:ectoine hydroxylase-related dioxygenase (phytanoyl-CoA dioxygenase family)
MSDAADRFARDGFAIVPGVVTAARLAAVEKAFDALGGGAGARELLAHAGCRELAAALRAHPAIAGALPAGHVAVQCTAFEKSAARNWLVTLHQDLAIPVAGRVDDPALRGWSRKAGTWFVQPPAAVLATLVAIRVHVDDCAEDDGPLQVVAGSHVRGGLGDADAFALRDARGTTTCPVARGGAMLMRPLLLHASSKARGTSRRRVLHYLFGPAALPHGLRWPEGIVQTL